MKKKALAMLLAVVMAVSLLPATVWAADGASGGLSVQVKAADGGTATVTFGSGTVLEALVPFEAGNEWATVILVSDPMTIDKAVDGRGYFGAYMKAYEAGSYDELDDMSYFYDWGASHGSAGSYEHLSEPGGPFFAFQDPDSPLGEDIYWAYDLVQLTAANGDPIYISFEGMEEFFLDTRPGGLPADPEEPEEPNPVSVRVKAADGGTATVTFGSGTVLEALIPFDTGNEWATVILVSAPMTIDKAVDGRGYFGAYMKAYEAGNYDELDDMSYFYDWGSSHGSAGSYEKLSELSGPFFAFRDPDSPLGEEIYWAYDLVQLTAVNGDPIYIGFEGMEEFFLETRPGELPGEPEEPEEPDPVSVQVKAADGGTATIAFSDADVVEALVPFEAGNEWVTVILTPFDALITFDKAVDGTGCFGSYMKLVEAGSYDNFDINYFYGWGPSHADAGSYTWTGAQDGPFFGFVDPNDDPFGTGMEDSLVWLFDMVQYTAANGDPVYIAPEGAEEFFLDIRSDEQPGEPVVPDEPVEFNDVAEDAWYYDAVQFTVKHKLISGVGDDRFDPNSTLTRGMVFIILGRAAGADVEGATPWYQKAMEWSVAEGISNGADPGGAVTREQLAAMLYRYAGSPETNTSALNSYPDSGSIHDWPNFREAMAWAVDVGIIQGSGGKLDPQGTANRAVAVTMIQRFCENVLGW